MKAYLASDSHLNHANMVHLCGRPENFDDLILHRTGELRLGRVTPCDLFIHCGDVSIGRRGKSLLAAYLASIYCKKVLVRGNHDRDSVAAYLSAGWDFVCDAFTLDAFGKRILFTHVPAASLGDNDVNVHGHQHNNTHRGSPVSSAHILLAQEYMDYRPIPLETLMRIGATPKWHEGKWRKI